MKKLLEKTCLITGAARGIGEAIAYKFAEEGANVIVTDINMLDGQKVASKVNGKFYKLDVSLEDDWQNCMSQVGLIDILVNNAGITGFVNNLSYHDPENTTLEDWHRVHKVNLDGVFLGCKYAIR